MIEVGLPSIRSAQVRLLLERVLDREALHGLLEPAGIPISILSIISGREVCCTIFEFCNWKSTSSEPERLMLLPVKVHFVFNREKSALVYKSVRGTDHWSADLLN